MEEAVNRGAVALIICWSAASFLRGGEVAPDGRAALVYARATNQFAAALFFKPAATTNADLTSQLAPLILQQVPDGQASAMSPADAYGNPAFVRDVPLSQFGLHHGVPSSPVSDSAAASVVTRPAVAYAIDSVQLEGARVHPQFYYEWFYATNDATSPMSLSRQGIRITLDARGRPAIWEVLADTSGLRLIFVSQSLEAAAASQFGKPLPGRRYAIERSLSVAPSVIVPRVIDDGPMAMGPIVYLSGGTRDVSTLICRCMPAQVKRLVATQTFDLAALEGAAPAAVLAARSSGSNAPPGLWPGNDHPQNRLERSLRLPAEF
jgi:hypothetical protein